jgi:hypothetical protein
MKVAIRTMNKLPFINEILKPLLDRMYLLKEIDRFGFNGIREHLIFQSFEAQIDTGNMMQELLNKRCQIIY